MNSPEETTVGDPLTAPFWEAARRGNLLIQQCTACGRHQFYPRPFCLACSSDQMTWVVVQGGGEVYSQTEVHMQVSPDFEPPYVVAIVRLDEGPKLMTNIVNGRSDIGDRVKLVWRARETKPPIPLFEPVKKTGR